MSDSCTCEKGKGLDNNNQDKIRCSGAVEIVEIFMVGVTYGWKELREGIFILYENEMLVHRTSFSIYNKVIFVPQMAWAQAGWCYNACWIRVYDGHAKYIRG